MNASLLEGTTHSTLFTPIALLIARRATSELELATIGKFLGPLQRVPADCS
jgi:hypothetical protein